MPKKSSSKTRAKSIVEDESDFDEENPASLGSGNPGGKAVYKKTTSREAEVEDEYDEAEDEDIDAKPQPKKITAKGKQSMKKKQMVPSVNDDPNEEEEQEEEEEDDPNSGGGQQRRKSSQCCGFEHLNSSYVISGVFVVLMIVGLVIMVFTDEPTKGYASGFVGIVFFVFMIFLCCVCCQGKRRAPRNIITNNYRIVKK
jgi:hypothetical protein